MPPTRRRQQQQQQQQPLLFLLYNSSEPDPWKRELMARLDRIRQACGELCTLNDAEQIQAHIITNNNIKVTNNHDNHNHNNNNSNINDNHGSTTMTTTTTFPPLRVPNVNCNAIMESADIDASDGTFPSTIPSELLPYFTVGGLIPFETFRIFRQHYQGKNAKTTQWTEEDIETQKASAMKEIPELEGSYNVEASRLLREKLRQLDLGDTTTTTTNNNTNNKKKRVLVIGSETPWVEAICLGLGAAHVTTLEYGRINSTHPRVNAMTPDRFRTHYRDGTLGTFDVVISHSSLEHSGLGRYGDALNPWGDILAVARAWCVTKPGGLLYLGLPTAQDRILFNAHRLYGKVRWSLITANWQQIDADQHTHEELEVEKEPNDFGGTGFLFRKVC